MSAYPRVSSDFCTVRAIAYRDVLGGIIRDYYREAA
jgi:hypothetical protein